MVTRLNGTPFAINPDLIERADATPDTVITLTSGAKYVVAESLETVIDEVRSYRASVVALAGHLEVVEQAPGDQPAAQVPDGRPLRVVPFPTTEG
jgi:flagellar protein FlbD